MHSFQQMKDQPSGIGHSLQNMTELDSSSVPPDSVQRLELQVTSTATMYLPLNYLLLLNMKL